jgi:hypothetical protein
MPLLNSFAAFSSFQYGAGSKRGMFSHVDETVGERTENCCGHDSGIRVSTIGKEMEG